MKSASGSESLGFNDQSF
jgi:hypothetical protein